jgi:adenosylcobinamide kinase/adenosylcobinamide-phosphate guanylyltransferase
MIFVTGPLFAGKRAYICRALGLDEAALQRRAVWDVQDLARPENVETLAEELARREIVIATEVGGGVVPAEPAARARREAAGRLACLLAERADTVVRVWCGLPELLKGEWPCASD